MSAAVVCLRPEADFTRVGVAAPASLDVTYRAPDDAELASLLDTARALVIPAVGPQLAPELFGNASLDLIQVTGAGVDRLDRASIEKRGIPVANVPGGSNGAVAEYATASASTPPRAGPGTATAFTIRTSRKRSRMCASPSGTCASVVRRKLRAL